MNTGLNALRARAAGALFAILSPALAACGADAGAPSPGGKDANAIDTTEGGSNGSSQDGTGEGVPGLAPNGEVPVDPGGDREVESCRAAAEGSSNEAVRQATAEAIELARAAPPDARLEIWVELANPEYDFGNLDISEREAQLDPSQDRIAALIEEHGGEVTGRMWLINAMNAELPAQHLARVFCWPDVVSLDVLTPYWDVVTPPWDPTSVGERECPVSDGACPAHCEPIEGLAFDVEAACLAPQPSVVACDRAVGLGSTADFKCRANEATGAIFWFGGAAPTAPAQLGYRECTDLERAGGVSAPSCG